MIPLALLPMLACYPNTREQDDSVAPSDTDSDADTDADTDTDTDRDTDTAILDADQDGYSEADGDCDDTDDAVHPGGTEVCDNGKDDDCDGSSGGCALTSRSLNEADAKFTGEASGDGAGQSVSTAGDVNGDGFDDVLVGASDPGNYSDTAFGSAYLILGSAAPTSRSLGAADAQFTGEVAEDFAGDRVSAAGDVNGDGFDDVLVGAWNNDDGGVDAGAAYLVLGSASPTSRSLRAADAQFTGETSYNYAGSVSAAGDVNDDGFDDVLVGSSAGAAYLILGSGAPTSRSLAAADAQFTTAAGGTLKVSTAGDVDGDGFDDLLVGSPYADAFSGAAYLVLGSTAPSSRSLGAADAQYMGEAPDDWAGISISTAGDVNGDGFDDVLVGAYRNDGSGDNGAVYLVLGSASPASRSLGAADAQFEGEAANDGAGISVSTAGDVDRDGFDDVLVGAHTNDTGGTDAGAAYLVLGSASPISLALGVADARFSGEAGNYAGGSVSTAGDVDGDGFDDVLVGAVGGGGAYLIFGTGI